MTGRVSPLALSLLAIAGWAVSLGVLSGRLELIVAALPVLLLLATLARPAARPDHAIEHQISGDRIFEGGEVAVTMTVTARSPIGLIELLGPRPAGSVIRTGSHRAVMSLAAGAVGRATYTLGFPGRGAHDLGDISVRVRDRLGLRIWERRHVDPRPLRVFPRIVPLRHVPRPVHVQASVGDYVSRVLGEGIEPGDIRQFAPGDRIKQVNWRASLRLGQLYVTQQHRERNADVVLMLDTLAEVGVPSETTLDLGVRAAASLATAYLARKDRVGLITYGGVMSWVRPRSGAAQYERLADALVRADVVFTYVAKDLLRVPPRVLSSQALVIAVTPLLDRRFSQAVLDLAARGFDLLVLVVSPVDITRAAVAPTPTGELAGRLWRLERRADLVELRRHGLPVIEWRYPESLEVALAESGRRRIRLATAG